jgi:hypothetical protein
MCVNLRPPLQQAQASRLSARDQYRGTAMKFLAATLTLLVSSAAAAQECKTCSMADACIKTYLKAASEAQTATEQAIRDWKQNLDRKVLRIVRQGHGRITRRHGGASSFRA